MGLASVFVHLGGNPSPQLSSMASAAKKINPSTDLFLITDQPDSWREFPGKLIEYSMSKRSKLLLKLARKNREMEEIAGGYWFYTLERIYALDCIYSEIGLDEPFLHYESDVLPLIQECDSQLFRAKNLRTAVPRFSTNRGIASVLYSPSQQDFRRVLTYFNEYLMEKNSNINDMDLLGAALNGGIIDELPTLPEKAWIDSKGKKVIFDGAALGQYLFGQDPFHTQNRRVSGFINPDFSEDLSKWNWNLISLEDKSVILEVSANDMDYRILNLHIHSKLILKEPSFDPIWIRAIYEANRVIPREVGELAPNIIHTSRVTLRNRFRLARKRGLVLSLLSYISRNLAKFSRGRNPR